MTAIQFIPGLVVAVALSGCGSDARPTPTPSAPPFTKAELAEFESNIPQWFGGTIKGTDVECFSGSLVVRVQEVTSDSKRRAAKAATLRGKRVLIVGHSPQLADLQPWDTVTMRVEYTRVKAESRLDAPLETKPTDYELRLMEVVRVDRFRPLQAAVVVGTVLMPPCVIAIATYGVVIQWRARRKAIWWGGVVAAVAASLWIVAAFVQFVIAVLATSVLLPPVVAGLAAGWLALRTRRAGPAFLVGLTVGPVVCVLTSVAIACLYYINGGGETVLNTLDVAFAVLLTTYFYVVVGWAIVALVTAPLCTFLVRRRVRHAESIR